MIILKQSTAGQEIPLGYFVDSTDGDTAETGLTISNTDIKLWKFGATSLVNKNSGGATHMSDGVYYCTLDATDTNTVGSLVVYVHESGGLTVKQECQVLEEVVYDAIYGASATGALPATLVQGGINTASGTITTLDGLDSAQDSQHSTTQGALSTVGGNVDAIKTKTDDLTFTTAGQVDANIQSVNDTAITGDGAEGTEWGPA